jgi:hypothetical protein
MAATVHAGGPTGQHVTFVVPTYMHRATPHPAGGFEQRLRCGGVGNGVTADDRPRALEQRHRGGKRRVKRSDLLVTTPSQPDAQRLHEFGHPSKTWGEQHPRFVLDEELLVRKLGAPA